MGNWGYFTLLKGVLTPFATSRGPPFSGLFANFLQTKLLYNWHVTINYCAANRWRMQRLRQLQNQGPHYPKQCHTYFESCSCRKIGHLFHKPGHVQINEFPQPNSLTPARINMKPCQNGMPCRSFLFQGLIMFRSQSGGLHSLAHKIFEPKSVCLNLAEISSDMAINIICIFSCIVCISSDMAINIICIFSCIVCIYIRIYKLNKVHIVNTSS